MVDSIADMLNRIRNSQAVSHPTVSFPFSKLKYEIAMILKKEGFVREVEKKGKKQKKTLEISLKYPPVISNLKRISKPGRRIYVPAKQIKRVQAGYGIAIISTSKGLMTNKEARKRKLGGEILCEIW